VLDADWGYAGASPHQVSTSLGGHVSSTDMLKLNKVDEEILAILKEIFLTKNIQPLTSDEHMRLWIIRSLLAVSVFGLIVRVFLWLMGKEFSAEFSALVSMPIALFFGLLFIHINNKSENTSLIVFVLIWISIVVGLYV
jgi:hypothetical protein